MLRKRVSSVLIVVFLLNMLGGMIASYAAENEFIYDFSSLEPADDIASSENSHMLYGGISSLNRSLVLKGDKGGAAAAVRENFKTSSGTPQAFWGTVYTEVKLNFDNISCQRIFRFLNENQEWSAGMMIDTDGKIKYELLSSGNLVRKDIGSDFTFEQGKEYNIKFTINLYPGAGGAVQAVGQAGTWDIAVNGETVAENLPFVHRLVNIQKILFYQSGEGSMSIKKLSVYDSYSGSWTAADFTEDYSMIDNLPDDCWSISTEGTNVKNCCVRLQNDSSFNEKVLLLSSEGEKSNDWVMLKKTISQFSGNCCFSVDFMNTGNGLTEFRIMNGGSSYLFWIIINSDGLVQYKKWDGTVHNTGIISEKNAWHNLKIYNSSEKDSPITVFDGEIYTDNGILRTTSTDSFDNINIYSYGNGVTYVDNLIINAELFKEDAVYCDVYDFSEDDTGSFPNGWTSQNPERIKVMESDNEKYLNIQKTIFPGVLELRRSIKNASGKFTIEFDMELYDYAYKKICFTDYLNRRDNCVPAVFLELESGIIYAYDGKQKKNIGSYKCNEKTSFKITVNTDTDKFAAAVNGVVSATDFEMRHKVINIGTVLFASGENAVSEYDLSGIKISYLKAPYFSAEPYTNIPSVPGFSSLEVTDAPKEYDWMTEYQKSPEGLVYEAENMKLDNYCIKEKENANNGKIIVLQNSGRGTAEFVFTGQSGKYSLNIGYLENKVKADSEYHLFLNDTEIDFWFGQFDDGLEHVRNSKKAIYINNGDVFKIQGLYSNDPCMLDYVEFAEPNEAHIEYGTIFEDRFWAPLDMKRSGWTIDESGGSVKMLSEHGALDFIDCGNKSVAGKRKFTPQSSGIVNLIYKMNIEKKIDGIEFSADNEDESVFKLVTKKGGLYLRGTGSEDVCLLSKYISNKTYTLKYSIDFERNDLGVYIDDIYNGHFEFDFSGIDGFSVKTPDVGCTIVKLSYVYADCGYLASENFALSSIQGFDKFGNISFVRGFSDASENVSAYLCSDNSDVFISKRILSENDVLNFETSFMIPEYHEGNCISLTNKQGLVLSLEILNNDLVCKVSSRSEPVWENIMPGIWYNSKIVLKNGQAKIYINNMEKAKVDYNKTDVIDYYIGSNDDLSCKMYIDDILIYDKEYITNVPSPEICSPKGMDIGIIGCDIWSEGQHFGWDYVKPYDNRTTFLGYYNDADAEAADWQLKWMLEHGINLYLTCWYDSTAQGKIKKPLQSEGLEKGFMNSAFFGDMKFAIIDLSNGGSEAHFTNDVVGYWIEHYFKMPNYYKINGKPVIFIWDPSMLPFGLEGARKKIIEAGFPGAVFVTNYLDNSSNVQSYIKNKGYDNVFCYNYASDIVENQLKTLYDIDSYNITDMIPFLSQGWGSEAWGLSDRKVNMTVNDWQKGLVWIRDNYIPKQNKSSLSSKLLLLGNWNEFGEGNMIIPSKLTGFGYLDAVRKVFTDGKSEHDDLIPLNNLDKAYADSVR